MWDDGLGHQQWPEHIRVEDLVEILHSCLDNRSIDLDGCIIDQNVYVVTKGFDGLVNYFVG